MPHQQHAARAVPTAPRITVKTNLDFTTQIGDSIWKLDKHDSVQRLNLHIIFDKPPIHCPITVYSDKLKRRLPVSPQSLGHRVAAVIGQSAAALSPGPVIDHPRRMSGPGTTPTLC